MTLEELGHNKEWKEAVVVFAEESWSIPFTEKQRSYKVRSDAKWFDHNMNGMSLVGDCLDGTDNGIRLDHYIRDYTGSSWKIERCYILN